MALYTPCLGETPDNNCFSCGKPANTEIQYGWHKNASNGTVIGGQYGEICEECYKYIFSDDATD